jgi:hypothetical protein
MEINQAFIAAVLTVIGYSLNDTVVVFDRIREFRLINKSWEFKKTVNGALNSTLSRTLNTSFTTLVVLLAIFLFGGESIRVLVENVKESQGGLEETFGVLSTGQWLSIPFIIIGVSMMFYSRKKTV